MSAAPRKGEDGLPGGTGRRAQPASNPDWAKGLRQLYDAVVEEPLPDSFSELLKKLDQDGDK